MHFWLAHYVSDVTCPSLESLLPDTVSVHIGEVKIDHLVDVVSMYSHFAHLQ